jgi:hypothetical protein
MSANPVLAINYQAPFSETSQKWQINSSQMSAAKLLQDYVENYKTKINTLHVSYHWAKNITISNFNFQISNISKSLSDIQNNKYSSHDAGNIMSRIVSDLKTINTRMKVFLEQEKITHQKQLQEKQLALSNIWNQISRTLDNLLLSVSNNLLKQKDLSSKEKKLVEILIVLREQNNRMKAFDGITFESQSQMEQYIKGLIWTIRIEFWKIKNL